MEAEIHSRKFFWFDSQSSICILLKRIRHTQCAESQGTAGFGHRAAVTTVSKLCTVDILLEIIVSAL